MRDKILNVKNEAIAQITDVRDLDELENIRIEYLGRKGKISELIKDIKKLPSEEKKEIGILLNEIKSTITDEINSQLENYDTNKVEWFDPTIPGIKMNIGHKHLISSAIEEIENIFTQIGFNRVRYPEVDWDYFAFEALNFDKDHPARDDWETYWVDIPPSKKYGPAVLTPHTSNGQVRDMLKQKTPPIRMLNIGKTYRRQKDISHTPMFHQFEGLVVDKDININHLKGTLDFFVHSYFGKDRIVRLRPHHFPFTEPSFEVDMSCSICGGKGCKLCKEGWLEILGAGMVHPNVLKAGGIDSNEFTGFAFGTGVERMLMMKEGLNIPDLRLLYSTDLRYLRQF